jgi:hypothetical protein
MKSLRRGRLDPGLKGRGAEQENDKRQGEKGKGRPAPDP